MKTEYWADSTEVRVNKKTNQLGLEGLASVNDDQSSNASAYLSASSLRSIQSNRDSEGLP